MKSISNTPWAHCTLEEKVERWVNARRVLRSMSRHERKAHWDMSLWGRKTACGTVACAAGHCAMDPWFIDQGFEGYFIDNTSACPAKFLRFTMQPDLFFGNQGTSGIFLNQSPRSVGQVIREMTRHIKDLKSGATIS